MGVTQILTKREAVRPLLDRKREEAPRRERGRDGGKNRSEIAQINEHIGRQNEIGRLTSHVIEQPHRFEVVIHAFGFRSCDHGRGKIASAQPLRPRPDCLSHQAGAATEIEGTQESMARRYSIKRGQ